MKNTALKKLTFLAIMIALDVVLSPILRIEGMAPMSSVMNVIAGVIMGPFYALIMALTTGILRMLLLGIPPLALTGAVFGAFLSGLLFRWSRHSYMAWLGEIIGTGLIGSLLSYPVMVWFTGSANNLWWFVYTPRFFGATMMGGIAALLILKALANVAQFHHTQALFESRDSYAKHLN